MPFSTKHMSQTLLLLTQLDTTPVFKRHNSSRVTMTVHSKLLLLCFVDVAAVVVAVVRFLFR